MTAFTVIIPTRERHDTLRSTLQTCVTQEYDNLTFLVSDNASQDATSDVVRSFHDPRIRYVRAANRLSMASNWEFALSHVDDSYVLVLGDDDGLLPHAISELAALAAETRCEALAWEQAGYTWPTCKGGKLPNRLKFSLSRRHEVRNARADLAETIAYRRSFKLLPSLYWGAVQRDVLRRATPNGGRFFNCVNPDMYSCMAITSTVDRFALAHGPYSVQGLSGHSTGVSFTSGDTSQASNVGTFWQEVDLPIHPNVAMVPASTVYLTEAYEHARDHVPGANLPPPNYVALFAAAMEEAAASRSEAAYEQVRDAVIAMGKHHGLEAAAHKAIEKWPFARANKRESRPGVHLLRNYIIIDALEFQITDVAGAAQLCFDTIRLYELGYVSPQGVTRNLARRVVDRLGRTMARVRP